MKENGKQMITSTLYLYTETPLHAGTGSGLSSIDLPIQRERTTQYPMIQGSGIKGKLRAALEGDHSTEMDDIVFGPSVTNGGGSDHAGALIAGDARLLLFPVRSLNGVFAYTTSYDILNRFKRDIEREQSEDQKNHPAKIDWKFPEEISDAVYVTTKSEVHYNNTIVLEEFSFDTQAEQWVDDIADWIALNALPDLGTDYWPNRVRSSLAILPNDVFRDFALYATEVITRVRIDRAKKTVERGALWTEEHLPADTLLYVPLYATKARKKDSPIKEEHIMAYVKSLDNTCLQLGGDETVGRGLVRVRLGN
jgi:CRISPR-associated protein Cmr4